MSSLGRTYEQFMAYRMMSLISRPFNEWPAFDMGLINDKGKKIREAKTSEEKDQFSRFMNIIRNIKRTINKLTGQAETKIGNLLIGSALLREELEKDNKIGDPQAVVDELLESISARYSWSQSIEESLTGPQTIEPGRYKLTSDFYESEPVFYIKESIQPNAMPGWNVYHLEDVLGRMYYVTQDELTEI